MQTTIDINIIEIGGRGCVLVSGVSFHQLQSNPEVFDYLKQRIDALVEKNKALGWHLVCDVSLSDHIENILNEAL